jgi:hypothetical protein
MPLIMVEIVKVVTICGDRDLIGEVVKYAGCAVLAYLFG